MDTHLDVSNFFQNIDEEINIDEDFFPNVESNFTETNFTKISSPKNNAIWIHIWMYQISSRILMKK